MNEPYNLDSLMAKLGDFGRYQGFQFFLHILSAVTAGLNMLSLATVAAIPDHRCVIPEVDLNPDGSIIFNATFATTEFIPRLESGKINSCLGWNVTTNSTYTCQKWIYDDTYYQTSRAIDWDFVCDRKWMGSVAQSIYMVGVLTGAVVMGTLADKYGRKPVFCISGILQLILGLLDAFTPEYYSFVIVRYIYGIFGSAGAYIPGFVLTMELVGPSKRSMCGIAFQAAFAFGIMLVAGWGSFIKDYQMLQIIYGLHSLVFFAHIWLMDESPRWLWSNGKVKEAVNIVQKALKINGHKGELDVAEYVSKGNAESRTRETEKKGMSDLFKTPNLRIKTINVCLCWFANSLVYYGLSFSTSSMKGNPYLNMFLMGAVELPSYVITVYLMDRLGRRILTAFCMLVGGVCCISAANMATGSTEAISVVMIGKFLIAASFAIIYNYSAELFPTVVRNSAMGLGSMAARCSGSLAPLLLLCDFLDPRLPSVVFAIIAIVSGTWVLFLPETLNKPMPSSIEDGENFGVGDTFFTSLSRRKRNASLETPPAKAFASEQMEPLR
ncbi:unnamed protein product [Brassicogethes aeneus]|uniref:Major facilitator superfamily (MFS) profile domain-containing protein n=1 Tax=Brassicogethes aeneus TaxID=1431903 RepID=A0A9P0B3P3_BRAAE|nr:unnamed protein product [Brassicogethes aeneus]